jgi:hypothetical protein
MTRVLGLAFFLLPLTAMADGNNPYRPRWDHSFQGVLHVSDFKAPPQTEAQRTQLQAQWLRIPQVIRAQMTPSQIYQWGKLSPDQRADRMTGIGAQMNPMAPTPRFPTIVQSSPTPNPPFVSRGL